MSNLDAFENNEDSSQAFEMHFWDDDRSEKDGYYTPQQFRSSSFDINTFTKDLKMSIARCQ